MSWLNDVSARKERAAVDKIGVSKERDFHNIPATLKQAEYIERHVSGQISPFPTLDLAKYAFAEHDGHVRLIPVTNGGKQKRGRLSSDDAGWNGAENAGDDLAERFLSASTRAQERAPLNPCRAWQPKAGGMSEAVKMWLVAEYASVGGERRAEYKAFDSAKEANTESKS